MEKDPLASFHAYITRLAREGRFADAIAETRQKIREAQESGRDEDALILYSTLHGVHALLKDDKQVLALFREQETAYPQNLSVKTSHAEHLFWVSGQHEAAIQKADEVVAFMDRHFSDYNRCLYVKGLACVELGRLSEAVIMLTQTQYYDPTLAERLIEKRVGLRECRQWLLDALENRRTRKARGTEVEGEIAKIESLITRIDGEQLEHS